MAGLPRSPEPLLGSDAAVDAAGPCQGLWDTKTGACQLDHRFAWSTTCNLTAAVQRSYTSAFSDQGPEASVASSHYQAPSPSSRPGSQTAPVQQAVEAADPENSALLGKVTVYWHAPIHTAKWSYDLSGPYDWCFTITYGPAHGKCRVKHPRQSYRKQGHRTQLLELVGTKAKFVKPKFVKKRHVQHILNGR